MEAKPSTICESCGTEAESDPCAICEAQHEKVGNLNPNPCADCERSHGKQAPFVCSHS